MSQQIGGWCETGTAAAIMTGGEHIKTWRLCFHGSARKQAALRQELWDRAAGRFSHRQIRRTYCQLLASLLMERENKNCWLLADAV
jgi:hypothetical protein